MQAGELAPDVGGGRIEGGLRADVKGELEASRTQVDGHNLVVATVDERRDRSEADRTATEDAHAVAGPHVGLVRGVHADREGLGEGRHVEREIVRHGVQATPVDRSDQQERGEPALGSAVADAAQLVVTRMHHDPVADMHARDLGTDPVDRAGDLVTEAHRLGPGSGKPAEADVRQVAATDAAHRDAHHRVVRPGVGLGDVVDARVARAVHSYLQHSRSPQTVR